MEYHPPPSETGPKPAGLNTFVYQEESECTLSKECLSSLETHHHLHPMKMMDECDQKSSMPELALLNSTKISNVKSKTSRKRIRPMDSSKTLDPESTSNEEVCIPFWNESSKAWSQKLSSCIEIDSRDLGSSSLTSSFQKLELNSWFTATKTRFLSMTNLTWPLTSLPSPLSLSLPITDAVLQRIKNEDGCSSNPAIKMGKRAKVSATDDEEEPVKVELRARRIRIRPTEEQRQLLNNWFGAVRFCYNRLVDRYAKVGLGGVNLAVLRDVIKDAQTSDQVWLEEIPGEVKDVAVRDFDKARKAHFAKLKKGSGKKKLELEGAKFKFRSKRDRQQSFEVRARDMMRKSGYFAKLNISNINASETLPDKLDHTIRFVKDRLKRYFVIVLEKVEIKPAREHRRKKTIALDPGVRTFQTTYDDTGLTTEWGAGDMKRLFKLCRHADRLQSEFSVKGVKKRRRRSLRKAWFRLIERIQNLVKEVHSKLAKWLCEEYTVILLPRFETSRMIRRLERKINTKTARNMVTWRHYQFRELLKAKAKLYSDVNVIECSEAYTSKTCGKCGTINPKLGGSKTFRCINAGCGLKADRDHHAARNILLRHLSLNCRSF